ncbi:MAG TPA: hydroxyacylglutathione hydrolase [Pseudorhodoplanes sp.]|jgi:hydroxyacylglutathione hydrolase|nr:hydroxyacylglutathione hydrolase [Pseudorhodoplanes sp.]
MPAQIHLFTCLSDNYGVLLHDPATGATASIDAPDAAPVEAALQATGWTLTDILVTHHHSDHTAGVAPLKRKYNCRVVGPNSDKFHADETVGEGQTVKIGQLSARVLETPGHTLDHIAYVLDADGIAFVGDTLFSIGCGRVIEGSAAQMWASLLKLRALPDDMKFYCGHEYTQANIKFALTIEPDNEALLARARQVEALRAAGKPTLPATIGAEKQANCFLRADIPAVAAAVGMAGRPAAEVFAEVRARKNRF